MKKNRYLTILAACLLAHAASWQHAAANPLPAPLPEFMNAEQLADWRAKKTAEFEAKKAQQKSTEAATFYTGKPYLEDAGTYAFLFRNYDPELSRWTSNDPSGFPDGANGHKYVANPLSELDYAGLFALSTTSPSVSSVTDSATGMVYADAWNLQHVGAGSAAAHILAGIISQNTIISSTDLNGDVSVSNFFVQNQSSPQSGNNPNVASVSLNLQFTNAPSGFGWIQMVRTRLAGQGFSAWQLDISSGAGPTYSAGPNLVDIPAIGAFSHASANDGDGGEKHLYTFAAVRSSGVQSEWTIYDGIFWGGYVYE